MPSCCPSWQFSSCLSCEESPGYLEQLIDSCLQSDAPSEPAFSACQPSSHYSPDAFQPLQLCFNQGLVSSGPQGSSHRCPQGQRESHPGAEQQQCGNLTAFRSLGCSWALIAFPWGAPNKLGEAAGWGMSRVHVAAQFLLGIVPTNRNCLWVSTSKGQTVPQGSQTPLRKAIAWEFWLLATFP